MLTGKRKEPFLGVLLTYPQAAPNAALAVKTPNLQARAVTLRPGEILAVGVLGAGNYATGVFLPAVKSSGGIVPVAIASAAGVSAQQAARRFGFGYATSQEEHIFSDPVINIVAVLTRHNQHTRQVLAAFQAGKKVYCEKPLAITAEQLDQVAAALNAEPQPYLMVGFNRRFAPLARRLKTFMDARREPLVAHYRINAGYLPLTHWLHDPQQGGGRIIGEGCHFVDFLTYLVGAAPTSVSARGLPDDGRYQEDNVLLTFTYPDGSIGTVTYLANGDKAFAKERVEVFSGGRVAVLDDFRSLEMARAGKRQVVRSFLSQDKGHRAAWQTFLAAIRTGAPPPIPYDHLLGVTRATLAAVESLRSGQVMSI
jgi:predicted dehydrogenase